VITLSEHAAEMLLSARRSAAGALVFLSGPPAALRELRDNGLVNSHFRLTRRGAAEHAARVSTQQSSGGVS
jgi:hypothetical protein